MKSRGRSVWLLREREVFNGDYYIVLIAIYFRRFDYLDRKGFKIRRRFRGC